MVILGLYRGYVGGYIGIMEKKRNLLFWLGA